jgi:hypothetical protein
MLSVIMLNGVIPSVVAPNKLSSVTGSTAVEYSTNIPTVKGLNPAIARRERKWKGKVDALVQIGDFVPCLKFSAL